MINTATTGDLGGRLAIVLFCVELMSQNPIFGLGELKYEDLAFRAFGYSPSPHNVFLETYILWRNFALGLWLLLCSKLIVRAFKRIFT